MLLVLGLFTFSVNASKSKVSHVADAQKVELQVRDLRSVNEFGTCSSGSVCNITGGRCCCGELKTNSSCKLI